MSKVTTSKLPLFPLNTVLFPGMLLPLHIFEPRYRLMIGRCLELNQPFGVVLIRKGLEVGAPAETFDVGTSAYITQHERQPDGRMNIQTVGYKRFRLQDLEQREPYMIGVVEDYPIEDYESPLVPGLVNQLQPALRTYLDVLVKAAEMAFEFDDLPDDGLALAYFLAISLPLPMREKQGILSQRRLPDMLALEHRLMRREMMLLDDMLQHADIDTDPDTPFSLN